MLTLEQAIGIATRAHAGQLDKDGVTPYIEHPLAVMAMVTGADEKIVAVLHDVPEDTDMTIAQLMDVGLSEAQAEALEALTHRPHEPYRDYVLRALANPIARPVKLADYRHNTDEARLARLKPGDAARLKQKYAKVADLIAMARFARHPKRM